MQYRILVLLIFGITWKVLGYSPETQQNKGDSLFSIGLYAESLEERLKSVSLSEKTGDCRKIAISYLHTGRAYYYLHDGKLARIWIQKSLSKSQSCLFDSLSGINFRNLGALFIEANKPDSASLYLNEARKLLKPEKHLPEIASLFAMLFEVALRGNQNVKQARQYLDSCQHYYQLVNDPNQTAFYFVKEGIYWQEMKEYKRAEKYLRDADSLYQSISSTEGSMYALTCLASLQNAAGWYKKAYQTQYRYMTLRDTIFKDQTAKNLARYQVQFETQNKEIENLELQQRNERQRIAFAVGIVVLIIIGLGIFLYRDQVHKRNMETQKREDLRARFAEVVNAQEEERTRIARDLHDNLGHLMAAIRLNTSAIVVEDDKNQRILDHTESIVDLASKEVRQLSHRLMPQSLSDLGLFESLRDMARRINESGKIKIEMKATGDIPLSKPMGIAVYRIIQEVLNNTLNHAKATVFSIFYEFKPSHFFVRLQDNGIGFEPGELHNGNGIGWQNIKSRVEMVNGSIQLNSEKGAGTIVEIRIPLQSLS
ncbi:MAG TPA: sensor histidine kinase [Catalimonadaceae bacterium]|nr:sensor histidine kinase [Catalimonadaceae bacterium]HPI12661.1 sensor histidine kinase [Catalimonadaceae bacterium]